jgi:hypothetical protein
MLGHPVNTALLALCAHGDHQHLAAITLLRRIDHKLGLAASLNNLGCVRQRLGRLDEAYANYCETRDLAVNIATGPARRTRSTTSATSPTRRLARGGGRAPAPGPLGRRPDRRPEAAHPAVPGLRRDRLGCGQ